MQIMKINYDAIVIRITMSSEHHHTDVNSLVRLIFSGIPGIQIEEHEGFKFEIVFNPVSRVMIAFDGKLTTLTIDESNYTQFDGLHNETVLLQKVDELVIEIPTCKTIELRLDESKLTTIRCGHRIDSRSLEIFETGESFHNHFGYRKLSYNSEKTHNNRVREMTVGEAITLLESSIKGFQKSIFDKHVKRMPMQKNDNLILKEFIMLIFNLIKDYDKEKDKCSPENDMIAEATAYVINTFGKLLKHGDSSFTLTKDIQFERQKIIIREAVQTVFAGFVIEESGDMFNYRVSIIYNVLVEPNAKLCLSLEFRIYDFLQGIFDQHYAPYYGFKVDLPPHKYKGLTVLHVAHLSKCGTKSGNSLLALVNKLARSIHFIEYAVLQDLSSLTKCDKDISLSKLKILTTGDSWYGSKGYYSPMHIDVMAHNKRLQNKTMGELLHVFKLDKLVVDAFPELDVNKMTVREFFNLISHQIRSFPEEGCTELQTNQIKALKKLMSAMSKSPNKEYKLEYHDYRFLFKIHHGVGKYEGGYKRGTKKRGTKKRGTKKR